MKRTTETMRRRAWLLAVAAATLAGCGAMDVKTDVLETAKQVRTGPEQAPFRTITNFSAALRCMDNHMITFGVQELSVLVEELKDETKKVNAGTRDMLISAVSDMTKRSRAVRLVVYGPDAGNLIGFLHQAERKTAYASIPKYDIKGSISQFDENVAKKEASLGGAIAEYFNFGYARTAGATIMGVDLTMVNTTDLSVVPGVTARNAALIQKQGVGLDADAQYKKLGVNFTTALSRAEGNAQALRNLIELAVIELFGKLTKTPYWLCLGADPQSDAVRTEIADWYYTMTGDATEMIAYFQHQLAIRGVYGGPIDGKGNPALAEAISRYRMALGLAPGSKIDREFFGGYLNADHARIKAESAAKAAAARVSPVKLSISTGRDWVRRGEVVSLTVRADRAADVQCFVRNATQRVQRLVPARLAEDARPAPGDVRFQMRANDKGLPETVACFAVPQEAAGRLVKVANFDGNPSLSFEMVRATFASAAGGAMGEAIFDLQAR